ncbi:MAG: GerMN domain-containing protein [Firmicutes bacterium]|nr:GerMN domain-containing protein [Bacillota bacterium]
MKGKTIFALGLCFVLIAAAIVYIIAVNHTPESEGLSSVNLYYIGDISGTLETEKRRLHLPESREEALRTVFNEYLNGPQTTNFSLADKDMKNFTSLVYPVDGNENIAKINFTSSYNTLSQSRKMLCIAGMVYTLTELDFLRNVYFYVDNEPIANMNDEASERYNRNNVAVNPSLEPEKSDRQQVVLYFTNAAHNYLVAEERSIEIKQSQTTEYQIVEQLIQGPFDSGLVPTISGDVKIKDIKTEEGICYVNLSTDFVTKHVGNTNELTAVYSIVNSLTELDNVNKVQFLIEGEKISDYKGRLDLGKTIERNTSIIYDEDKE